jgi:hypothetical protein
MNMPQSQPAMVTVALERKDGGSAKNALELLRTVNGKAWENTATVFRQIDMIGSKSIKSLAIHGITCQQEEKLLHAFSRSFLPFVNSVRHTSKDGCQTAGSDAEPKSAFWQSGESSSCCMSVIWLISLSLHQVLENANRFPYFDVNIE